MDIIGIVFFVVFGLVVFGVSITLYVLRAFGLYRLASRANIEAPWLAWIPIGDAYIMGALSKMSPYVMKKFPKMNIILPVIYVVSIAVPLIFQVAIIFSSAAFDVSFSGGFEVMGLITFIVFYFITILFSLFLAAVYIFVLYHIYKTYDPQNAVLYTVLSVFGLSFIFLFIIRNRASSAKIEDI